MSKISFIVIAGPTASGKSALAMELAEAIRSEIVCCDSVQIYRGFDIGSAKPTAAERQRAPHHLFDLLEPTDDFSAGEYRDRALGVIRQINSRGVVPIVVGGTGLYLRALMGQAWDEALPGNDELRRRLSQMSLEQIHKILVRLDPERARQIHPNDRYRLSRALELRILTGRPAVDRSAQAAQRGGTHQSVTIIMEPPRPVLHDRIAERTKAMLSGGLVREVQTLLANGCPPDAKPMRSIGYLQVTEWLESNRDPDELNQRILAATRQYAKRQVTWFKKTPATLRISSIDLAAVRRAIDESGIIVDN